jgi:hypothetical protein
LKRDFKRQGGWHGGFGWLTISIASLRRTSTTAFRSRSTAVARFRWSWRSRTIVAIPVAVTITAAVRSSTVASRFAL